MERVNRIAMHLMSAPTDGTLVAQFCAGWKVVAGPHPSTQNMVMWEVPDEKSFLAFIEDSFKKRKAAGGTLPTSVAVYKMDSGLYMYTVTYKSDMDRVAALVDAREMGNDPRSKELIMKKFSVLKLKGAVFFTDERPLQITGKRIGIARLAWKSPEHLQRMDQLMGDGSVQHSLSAEYTKAGVAASVNSQISDTSSMTFNILHDEAAYMKEREALLTKVASTIGLSAMDHLASVPEREMGTCIMFKNIDEF